MPEGPLGIPRPIATSTINIHIDIRRDTMEATEVVVENAIRTPSGFPSGDVVVSESFEHGGFTITIITRREEVGFATVVRVLNTVRQVTGVNFDEQDVTVRAR